MKSLTRRSGEPRTVLIPSVDVMRTSFLTRAVADLESRWMRTVAATTNQ